MQPSEEALQIPATSDGLSQPFFRALLLAIRCSLRESVRQGGEMCWPLCRVLGPTNSRDRDALACHV